MNNRIESYVVSDNKSYGAFIVDRYVLEKSSVCLEMVHLLKINISYIAHLEMSQIFRHFFFYYNVGTSIK